MNPSSFTLPSIRDALHFEMAIASNVCAMHHRDLPPPHWIFADSNHEFDEPVAVATKTFRATAPLVEDTFLLQPSHSANSINLMHQHSPCSSDTGSSNRGIPSPQNQSISKFSHLLLVAENQQQQQQQQQKQQQTQTRKPQQQKIQLQVNLKALKGDVRVPENDGDSDTSSSASNGDVQVAQFDQSVTTTSESNDFDSETTSNKRKQKNSRFGALGATKRKIQGSRKKLSSKLDKSNASLICGFPGCGQLFMGTRYLKRHALSQHNLKKPFCCPESGCSRAFGHLGDLTRHKMTHTGERPHVCSNYDCGKSFSRRFSLMRHLRTHSSSTSNHHDD